jgi:hypothetical protein
MAPVLWMLDQKYWHKTSNKNHQRKSRIKQCPWPGGMFDKKTSRAAMGKGFGGVWSSGPTDPHRAKTGVTTTKRTSIFFSEFRGGRPGPDGGFISVAGTFSQRSRIRVGWWGRASRKDFPLPKSEPERGLPRRLAARGTKARRRQVVAAAAYLDERDRTQREYRAATLRNLNQDSEFVLRTARVKQSLTELRKATPALFMKFFRRLSPLILLNRSHVRELLREVGNGAARKIFRDYVHYASRFKVRMITTARSFRLHPFDPPEFKYRAKIVDGHLRPVGKEHPPESIYEYLFVDDGMTVVPELEEFIVPGNVKFFRVDDSKGGSLLNEIEYLAYQPSGLTFIVHHAQQPRIYLLIGENLSTDTFLRSAGKVVTALQKKLFNRKKAGRPTNISRLRKVIRISNQATGPLEQAFAIARKRGLARDLDTAGRYIRRVKASLNARSK